MPATRAGDFTQQAVAYSRARPGYPIPLLERLLQVAQVRPGDTIVDLGAGTGIFTGLLTGRGLTIHAVEPNGAMRQQALALPGVQWIDGTFEQTSLPDSIARWAVAAQAFHWADPPRALPEIARILERDGVFTILWNDRQMDRTPLLNWVQGLLRRHAPTFDEAYRSDNWPAVLTSTGHFANVRFDQAEHIVPMSAERFLNLWRSHNRLTIAIGKECIESMIQEIDTHLRQQCITIVDVHYMTRAWTAQRSAIAVPPQTKHQATSDK